MLESPFFPVNNNVVNDDNNNNNNVKKIKKITIFYSFPNIYNNGGPGRFH